MGAETKIQWCDFTASPWHGCSHGVYTDADGNEHEHPGCAHCYAEAMAKRNPATLGKWGPDGTRVRSATFADKCRRWNAAAEKAGKVASVFPSICDPFEDWQGPILDAQGKTEWTTIGMGSGRAVTMADLRRDLFATIDACPWLRFYLLTKRPGNVRKMWPATKAPPQKMVDEVCEGRSGHRYALHRPNVHLLTSISDQATADAMIPPLLKCRDLVPVLGVSAEPLLGPVDLAPWLRPECSHCGSMAWVQNACGSWHCHSCESARPSIIDWLIVGGESGHGARPCNVAWVRSIVEQCRNAGVACFVKQLGANIIDRNDAGFEAEHWTWAEGESAGLPVEAKAWPTPDSVEHDIHGFREDYQGADCRVRLGDKKGGTPDEWPADLRVRQFPEVPA